MACSLSDTCPLRVPNYCTTTLHKLKTPPPAPLQDESDAIKREPTKPLALQTWYRHKSLGDTETTRPDTPCRHLAGISPPCGARPLRSLDSAQPDGYNAPEPSGRRPSFSPYHCRRTHSSLYPRRNYHGPVREMPQLYQGGGGAGDRLLSLFHPARRYRGHRGDHPWKADDHDRFQQLPGADDPPQGARGGHRRREALRHQLHRLALSQRQPGLAQPARARLGRFRRQGGRTGVQHRHAGEPGHHLGPCRTR